MKNNVCKVTKGPFGRVHITNYDRSGSGSSSLLKVIRKPGYDACEVSLGHRRYGGEQDDFNVLTIRMGPIEIYLDIDDDTHNKWRSAAWALITDADAQQMVDEELRKYVINWLDVISLVREWARNDGFNAGKAERSLEMRRLLDLC